MQAIELASTVAGVEGIPPHCHDDENVGTENDSHADSGNPKRLKLIFKLRQTSDALEAQDPSSFRKNNDGLYHHSRCLVY